ncbi:hypothetical protein NKH18_33315 [Streptomyces sp. M10(2022)]
MLARTRGASEVEAELAEIRQVEATSRDRAGLREVFAPGCVRRSWWASGSPCSTRSSESTRSSTTHPRR